MAVKRYNGTNWEVEAGSQGITYAATAPTTPAIGDVWVSTADISTFDSLVQTGNRNAIINGGFDHWQRGATFTSPSGVYVADRWNVSQNGGPATTSVARTAFPLGIASTIGVEANYFLKSTITATSTTSRYSISQRIEDVKKFAGQTVAASFWARADANRATNVYLLQNFGTGGSSQVAVGLLVANLTTSWQKFTFSVTVPSISGKTIGTDSNFEIRFDQVVAVGSVFDLWGVQVEAGSVATPFEHRPIGTELALCQRYYNRLNGSGTSSLIGTGYAYSTTGVNAPITAVNSLRTAASSVDVSGFSVARWAAAATLYSSGATTIGATLNANGVPNITYVHGSAVFTLGEGIILVLSATGYLGFSAEL